MPEDNKGIPVDVSILFREEIMDVLPEEIFLIESNLPELLKDMLEEMNKEGE